MHQAKRTIAARISEKTGLNVRQSKKALKITLDCIKQALAMGMHVDLAELGKLVVVTRLPARRINRMRTTIENVYKRHPKTVRLLGGQDLSENPQPTIVHRSPSPEVKIPARSRVQVAIAFPSWRRRIR
jgi:nucleoid DNA-binding protein